MKKEQFRSMVKEIIKEVISEMDEGMNSYPAGGVNDPKIDAKNASKQKWAQGMKTLKGIHDEPDFKSKLSTLRKQQFDDQPVDEQGKQHSMFPKDDAAGPVDDPEAPVPQSSDQKIAARNAAWKNWEKGMKTLRSIHDEPGFKAQQHKLRQQQFDEPGDNATM